MGQFSAESTNKALPTFGDRLSEYVKTGRGQFTLMMFALSSTEI